MPMHLRRWFFGLLLFVMLTVTLPFCVGAPMFAYYTVSMVDEYAPTAEDQRLAEEIEDASAAAGRDVEISAQEIALARRMGRLDEVEAAANEMSDGIYEANRTLEPEPKKRARGAFYRDQVPEPEPVRAFAWEEVGLAVVGFTLLLGALGAAGAAFVMLGRSPAPPDEPT